MTDTVPYYEDFVEIKKKIWSMLNNAVKDRNSQFRIPVFSCGKMIRANSMECRRLLQRKEYHAVFSQELLSISQSSSRPSSGTWP